MAKSTDIHTRKFYRVILESIDPQMETPDSFAVKLSLRLRMTAPRARSVARHLPCTIRSQLSINGANRLKAVLEEIGGRVRLDAHYVTPGQESDKSTAPSPPDLRVEPILSSPEEVLEDPLEESSEGSFGESLEGSFEGSLRGSFEGSLPSSTEEPVVELREDEPTADTFICPSCGNEEAVDATFCSICHRKFRDPARRNASLGSRIPHDNPLEGAGFRTPDVPSMGEVWQGYKWLIIAAAVLLMLIGFILKQ